MIFRFCLSVLEILEHGVEFFKLFFEVFVGRKDLNTVGSSGLEIGWFRIARLVQPVIFAVEVLDQQVFL